MCGGHEISWGGWDEEKWKKMERVRKKRNTLRLSCSVLFHRGSVRPLGPHALTLSPLVSAKQNKAQGSGPQTVGLILHPQKGTVAHPSYSLELVVFAKVISFRVCSNPWCLGIKNSRHLHYTKTYFDNHPEHSSNHVILKNTYNKKHLNKHIATPKQTIKNKTWSKYHGEQPVLPHPVHYTQSCNEC